MEKAQGAFLTIGELAGELGVPQHILRYWETRFPQLRPLQRSGNRRYYRPADAALARRINDLLNVQGFTVKGARKALADGDASSMQSSAQALAPSDVAAALPVAASVSLSFDTAALTAHLESIRQTLVDALA